jgi:hypothetical protein
MHTHPSAAAHHCTMVERRANMAGISLRSRCHCNPGAREVALGYSTKEMAVAFKDKDRLRYEQFLLLIDGKTTGGGAGLGGRVGRHLRRCLPVLGIRQRLPRHPVRRDASLSRPDG